MEVNANALIEVLKQQRNGLMDENAFLAAKIKELEKKLEDKLEEKPKEE